MSDASKTLARQVLRTLKKHYPQAGCSLEFRSPIQLLVATILSAQCTDVQVNKITPNLFQKFPDAEHFAKAPLEDIEDAIKSTGFYHNKAKNIQAACRRIIEVFGGKVPATMDELISLPGVGRKTANVVLGNVFGKNEGFVVDTHVFRLSRRMGLAEGNTPEKVEQELIKRFPQKDWAYLSHAMILLGRGPCDARRPDCEHCPMKGFCPKIIKKPTNRQAKHSVAR